jgi:hypothetical protein
MPAQSDILPALACTRLGEFHRFLGRWRRLLLRHKVKAALGPLLGPIDDELCWRPVETAQWRP